MPFDIPFDVVELVPWTALLIQGGRTAPLVEVRFREDAWLPQDVARLRHMFAADAALGDIAATLGRTVGSVQSKIYTLGLRRISLRGWTELDDEYLVRHYGTAATSDVSAALGRSAAAVYARAGKLGLTEGNPPPYTPWEDAQIKAGYAQGVPLSQLAVLIGRPASGLVGRASHLGLRHANKPVGWTDAEQVRLLELAETGMLYGEIGQTLGRESFIFRTQQAVGLFLRKLGYERGWGRPWTDEEDDLLREAYRTGASLTPLVMRLNRSRHSIRWRVGHIGLQGTHSSPDGFRQGPVWTKQEDATLRREYGKTDTDELARKLGRLVGGVRQRANVLGLVHGWCTPFTEAEDEAIRIAYRVGLTLGDLVEATGRDVAVLSRHAKRMGLHFSKRGISVDRSPRAKRRRIGLNDILAMAHLPCALPGAGGADAAEPMALNRPRPLASVQPKVSEGRALPTPTPQKPAPVRAQAKYAPAPADGPGTAKSACHEAVVPDRRERGPKAPFWVRRAAERRGGPVGRLRSTRG